jgi:hypothetical protein
MDEQGQPAQSRGLGRPVGSFGTMRKAADAYSENQHTKKARNRFDQLSAHEKEVERSKNAYNLAIRRMKGRLAKSGVYINASPDEKETLVKAELARLNQY